MTLLWLAVGALGAVAAADDAIERGQYWWTFSNTDCMPGDEIGTCGTPGKATVQECKAACWANPNCGGFNIPNGHLKKLGCADEMVPWGDDPAHKAPVDPGHHALTLYTLGLYPPRREYWWELPGWDCNPDHELGSCFVKGLGTRALQDHCKSVCDNDIFCEGFNLPSGHLKAAGCKSDLIYEPKWYNSTIRLYFKEDRPQTRTSSWDLVRKYEKMDCNPGQELGNCSQYLPPPYTESECASACRANPLCGGFNLPNGHLKTVDCVQEVSSSTHQDLYLFLPPSPRQCQTELADLCGDEKGAAACLQCAKQYAAALDQVCTASIIENYCEHGEE